MALLCFHTGLIKVAVFNISAKTRMSNNSNNQTPTRFPQTSEEQGFETPVGTQLVCSWPGWSAQHSRLLQCCYQKMSSILSD
jgi:hypothetical protein